MTGSEEPNNASKPIPDPEDVVKVADIESARKRISGEINETPLDFSRTFADWSGAESVGLKLENMQRTGSFKIRGALNAIHNLSTEKLDRGVVTASAGNHAQGVALAGQQLDVDATIVVPEITPAAKIAATRGYGADVIVHGAIYEDSYEHALNLANERQLTFVHPFDNNHVIAGQGTIGLELLEQQPNLDTVLVAIGGGGLISGIATALKSHNADIRVIGVQPEGAAHAKLSLEQGEIHRLEKVDTVADGIADLRMLPRTFAVANKHVDDVVTVSDDTITTAVTLLAERAKTVAEPAGATPVAALLDDSVDLDGQQVSCVISGGNIDLTDHGELTQAGLMQLGRRTTVRLGLTEWPIGLSHFTEIIRKRGATLVNVERKRRTNIDHPNRIPVTASFEGSSPDHLESVIQALDEHPKINVVNKWPSATSSKNPGSPPPRFE